MSPLGFEGEQPLSVTMCLAVHALSNHELLSTRAGHAQHKTMVYVQKYSASYRNSGNVRINDDSKSHTIIPIAWRVTMNPIYVRCGQSARDDKSHIRTLRAECV